MREIETNYKVVSGDLHTIEKIGGGSARSMLAELFWNIHIFHFNLLRNSISDVNVVN